jgi:hypothetical protein
MAKKTNSKKSKPKSKKVQTKPKKSPYEIKKNPSKPMKNSLKSKRKQRSKKGLLITILVIVLAIIVGGYFLFSNFNLLIKMAIEKFGSQATQTAVRVSSVKISLKDGSGGIYGLSVGNPKGFEGKYAFSLGEAGTKINVKSITEEVKIIDDITIKAPKIYVEVNKDKKNNLEEIQKNLPTGGTTKPKAKEPKKKKKGKEPKLIIRRFHFSKANIHALIVPLNKEYDLNLPAFEMRNIGGPNGATPPEIAKQVITEITKRALAEVKKKGIGQGLAKVTDKAKSQISAEEQKAKSKLKGLLKK